VSSIPGELRDTLVRKLENALDEREHQLSQAEGQVHSLRRAVGETEGVLARQRELLRHLESEIQEAGRELDRERAQALERLERLRQRAEEQHRRLQAALDEAERRHRQEWEALEREIQSLKHQREERERLIQKAAGRSLRQAGEVLARLDRDEIERLDLRGDLAAAEIQLESARALASQGQSVASEALSAAHGAEEALRKVEGILESRRALLTSLAEQLRDDASWLDSLLAGAPMLDLPDQTDDLSFLLTPEQSLMRGLIEREMRAPLARLARWNGHGALVARLSGVRDLLGAEIVAARKALPAARDHEEARYDLGHVWDDLELRFGFIRYRGEETPGAWADPGDRKSTYFYFLDSQHGEIRVDVPWSSDLLVHHEDRLIQRSPLALEPGEDAVFIGGLGRRWRELSERLDNPNWTPDWQGQGGVR
jgi:hypothetical protein